MAITTAQDLYNRTCIEKFLHAGQWAAAVSLVMANCIQQNWGPEIIAGLLASVSVMCEEIPVFRLGFIPDQSIIEHITKNE